jgi:membrane protein DedA with SNARE-associated domain
MSGVVAPILQWLNENPELAGFATFTLSAAESIAIIGTIVPGLVTMTAVGALAGAGVIPLYSTIFWAILGAIAGDGISYWLGHYFKDRLRRMWPFRDNPGILEKGEHFVHKFGVISVFIGRFVGPVRALVPLVAGMLGMRPWHFTISNVTSAILWAPAYMLPGIMLGAASMELPPDIALHVILVFFIVVLFFALCFWLIVKIIQLIHIQIDQMQNWIWQFMKKHSLLRPLTVLLKHHDATRSHGQLNLAFYFLIFSGLFLILSYYVHTHGASNITINDAFYHLFRGIRYAAVDSAMIVITLLGQKQVIAPVILCIFAYLFYTRQYRVAAHVFLLVMLAISSVFVFKNILQSVRPWGIFKSPDTYSMPSGHTVISTVFYFGLAFLLATSARIKRGQWLLYTCAFLICLSVAFSRLYLGAHWFTDVVAGWLMGAAILCFVIISYERTNIHRINAKHFFLVTLVSLMASVGFYYQSHFTELKTNYAQLDWPVSTINAKDWWAAIDDIPARRISLFGFPSQPINIQWAGNLDDIRNTLIQEGWTKPPARDLVSTFHRIADISSTQYLPMISPQYLDKTPALILTKNVPGISNMLVIRFWDSSRIMESTNIPLWVGIIGTVPRTYSWVFRRTNNNMVITPDLIFSHPANWTYKIANITYKTNHNRAKLQRVLLVKPQSLQ